MIAGTAVRAKSGKAGVNVPYRSLMVSHNKYVPANQPSNANVRNSHGRTIKRVAMRPRKSTVKNSARAFNDFAMVVSKLEIIIYVSLYNQDERLVQKLREFSILSQVKSILLG